MLRAMLVDDEEDALDLLEILLQKIGNVTIVGRYSDPIQALKAIEDTETDVVFLDIDMPGLKGTKVARKMKEIVPQLMIVFITAYSEYAVEAFEIQSDDYLLKPYTLERLQRSISRTKRKDLEHQIFRMNDTPFSIQCMGGFYLHIFDNEKRSLKWKTNKAKEVCAFLIHHCDKPVDADVIIEAVWPNHDLKKAKSYLYTCLSYLRKALIESNFPIEINNDGKGFILSVNGMKSDEDMFRRIVMEIISKEDLHVKLYNQLNALYKGEYMEGCGFQWALPRQIELKNMYIRALHKMYEYFRNHNVTIAEESLQRVLRMAPDSEKDARELIRLYMESGKRNEAISIYRELERAVHELGIELEPETVQLYDQMNLFSR